MYATTQPQAPIQQVAHQHVMPQQHIEMVSVQPQPQPMPTYAPQVVYQTHHGLAAFSQSMQANQGQVKEEEIYSAPSKGITAVKLTQSSWIKSGCAVSYTGAVKFVADSVFTKGCWRAFKEWQTGEGMKLMKATDKGSGAVVYVADEGKIMVNIALKPGESVICKGEDIVAFEESVRWDIERLKGGLSASLHGGKYFIRLSGPGNISIGCHGDPFVMPVTPNAPIRTDPDNTVLWTKNTVPSTKHSHNILARMIGCFRETGEEKQWQFSGEGFVVIQPVEEFDNSKRAKIFGIF